MPIDYKKYPKEYFVKKKKVRQRSGNECELCGAPNGEPHWKTGSIVVLTCAHIDQVISHNVMHNLLDLCQRCHLKIDLPYKVIKMRKAFKKKRGQKELKL